MPNYLVVTSGDGFDAAMRRNDFDFVIVQFSRREVMSGLTGDAVDRLLRLSEDPAHVRAFTDRLILTFEGFDADFRELYEIPECVAFFRAVHAAWPYWFHFLEKSGETLALVLRLLCPGHVLARTGERIGFRFDDAEEVGATVQRLFVALNSLYEEHRLGEPALEAMSATVAAALDRAFA